MERGVSPSEQSEELLYSLVLPELKHRFIQEKSRQEFFLEKQYADLIDRINHLKNLTHNITSPIVFNGDLDPIQFSFNQASPKIVQEFQQQKKQLIEDLIPWRKGPIDFFSTLIDSEWDSSIKWHRLAKHLGEVKDKVVCDLGCNNGYFMLRLLSLSPALVVGLDPVFKYYLQYYLLNSFLPDSFNRLVFLLMGFSSLTFFKASFDFILCLGILYHHPNPIEILQLIKASLKPGGKVIIDCQGIDQEGAYCLFPEKTYAGKKGFWFLPTPMALLHWIKKANFSRVEIISQEPILEQEQRKTTHSPIDSLAEGLSKDGKTTIEGYPPPIRIYLVAEK